MKNAMIDNQFRFLMQTLLKSNQIFLTPTYNNPSPTSSRPDNGCSNGTGTSCNSCCSNSTIKAILNILNIRGVLAYILTSNYALHHISTLPSLSLVHFISAIIDLEVTTMSSSRTSSKNSTFFSLSTVKVGKTSNDDQDDQDDHETLLNPTKRRKTNEEGYYNPSTTSTSTSTSTIRNHSNYIPSILQFLERVLRNRWSCMDSVERKIDTDKDVDVTMTTNNVFAIWSKYLQKYEKLAKQPSDHIEHNHHDTTSGSSDSSKNSYTQNNDKDDPKRNIFPILDTIQKQKDLDQYNPIDDSLPYEYNEKDEEWVICITFVLVYKCLFHQIDKVITPKETINTSKEDSKGNDETESNKRTSQESSDIFCHTVKMNKICLSKDRIITKSLRIILLLFLQTTKTRNDNNTSEEGMNQDKENGRCKEKDLLLQCCFPNHWMKLVSFVKTIHNESMKDSLERENEKKSQVLLKDKDEEKSSQSKEDLNEKEEEPHIQKAMFEKLWNEIQVTTTRTTATATKMSNTTMIEEKEATPDVIHTEGVSNISKTLHKNDHTMTGNEASKRPTKAVDATKSHEELSIQSTSSKHKVDILDDVIQQSILDLRLDFFAMGKNATSNVINDMTHKTMDLLQKACKENGAVGIKEVAKLLKYGKTVPSKTSDSNDTTRQYKDTEAINDDGSLNKNDDESTYHFSDLFVSSLCKASITEETSAVRASMIMSEFVLPSIVELKFQKTRAASRVMISTLSFLANYRPSECASSLLVPALCHSSEKEGLTRSESIPTKAQCELVSKIVKQGKLPKDVLGSIVANLTTRMIWDEQTVPVLTTCLQKKAQLSSNIIDLVVEKICCSILGDERIQEDLHVKEKESVQNIRKGMKFSTLFHTFVTKYGKQINNTSKAKKLLDAAGSLKTILGKSICSSLKKL